MYFSEQSCSFLFFFNDTATTEIYTLSLHDALPILRQQVLLHFLHVGGGQIDLVDRHDQRDARVLGVRDRDRKSTRLNSSHSQISYAVFCLKKKKTRILL